MVDNVAEFTSEPAKLLRILLLVAGITLGQVILYGPSLVGHKILLPLDILAQQNVYIPRTPEIAKIEAQNPTLTDQVYVYEPNRCFASRELLAGRLPMWTPFEFAGVPFIWPKFSPFLLIESFTPSPVVVAWVQLLVAMVAGLGAYMFFRRVLKVSFWPAIFGAWCYPLTGFFVFWQGSPTSLPVSLLPWLFLMTHLAVQHKGPRGPIGLSALTALVLVSGFPDVAAQVLLGAGLFGLWECAQFFRLGNSRGEVTKILVRLAAGWILGILIASPYLLPVIEYSQTGGRLARRGAGQEERPPVGLAALPQVVLPDMYGASRADSVRFTSDHHAESSAAAYAGVLATLLVAPLAFCSRRHRGLNIFWLLLSFFALAWCLNVPGVVNLLRLPGPNMMSHNRLVFLAALAFTSLAVVGLEVLRQGLAHWRPWFWLFLAALTCLCFWSVYRTSVLPEPIRTRLVTAISQGKEIGSIHNLEGVARVQKWFIHSYASAALWCGLGALGWFALRGTQARQRQIACLFGALLWGDLIWFAHGRSVQCDPALYYPDIPVLHSVAQAGPGRVMGYGCLPATLSAMSGLRDVRGYDAVDPARMIDLVSLASEGVETMPRHARTMQVAPKAIITPSGDIRVAPVLDMLGVRYVIMRGSPPANASPVFQGVDYWVLKNPAAMDRVFVPQRVELVSDDKARLEKMGSPMFNPREVAYVEIPVSLPAICAGKASVVDENPTRIRVDVQMETAGLVVLADRWDKGWRGYLNGKSVPILCANHAIRGVIVPTGSHRLEFRYEPASFAWGLRMCGLALAIIAGWVVVGFVSGRKRARISQQL